MQRKVSCTSPILLTFPIHSAGESGNVYVYSIFQDGSKIEI